METDLQFLKTNFESQVDGDLTVDDYPELCTNQSTISDKDIIRDVLNHPVKQSSDKEDDAAEVVEMRKPFMGKVKNALEMLEKFSLYSDFGEDILKSIRQVSHSIEREEQTKRKQANITDFFKKID